MSHTYKDDPKYRKEKVAYGSRVKKLAKVKLVDDLMEEGKVKGRSLREYLDGWEEDEIQYEDGGKV